MKIAIATDSGMVSPHFGRCPEFTILEVDRNEVLNKEPFINPGHEPGLIPQVMKDKGVSCVITGGVGERARMIFEELGIQLIGGVAGSVESVINELLNGTLEAGKNTCDPGQGKGYGVEKKSCDHGE